MGIKGLHPLIKDACFKCSLADPAFRGTRPGVDISLWLYKAIFAPHIDHAAKAISYTFEYIELFKTYDMHPVFVFDGRRLPAKAVTHEKRDQLKNNKKHRAAELMKKSEKCTDALEAMRLKKQSCKLQAVVEAVTNLTKFFIDKLQAEKLDYIIPPYEADAQLTWLAKHNVVDFVITEDSDLVAFGCPRILFKLNKQGFGFFYDQDNLHKVLNVPPQQFDFPAFQKRCILAGCDYLPSIPGIGMIKAGEIMDATIGMTTAAMLAQIQTLFGNLREYDPVAYAEGFDKAEKTFQHQVVFDLKLRQFVHLNLLPSEITSESIQFVGDLMQNVNAVEFAYGNINFNTLKPSGSNFNPTLAEYPSESIWHPTYEVPSTAKPVKPVCQQQPLLPHKPKVGGTYKCEECGREFKKPSELKLHWYTHTAEKLYNCTFEGCKYGSHNQALLVTHLRVHTGEKPYQCAFGNCAKTFIQKYAFVLHLRTHTGEKPFQCTFKNCKYTCAVFGRLKNHNRTHTGEKPYRCLFGNCQRTVSISGNLVSHLRTHTQEKPFMCKFKDCGSAFKRSCHLVSHKWTHTEQKRFVCTIGDCTSSFAQQAQLVLHQWRHDGEKKFKCTFETCTSSFARPSDLARHQRTTHEGVTYKCQFGACKFRCKTYRPLVLHVRKHTKEKPYPCKFGNCKRVYFASKNLSSHVRRHTGEKPYRCTIGSCTSEFTTSHALYRHRRIHTGEKPYKCTFENCTFATSRSDQLAVHRRRIHSV